jgi:catechol 2,3-dioxygenase-like lactoylglutathione lyase family enzyme
VKIIGKIAMAPEYFINFSRLLILIAVATLGSGCAGSNQKRLSMSETKIHNPLQGTKVMAFAAVRDLEVSRAFYEGKLGLRVISQDALALMLDWEGTIIRIQKIPAHQPVMFTVLGWQVKDIGAVVSRLAAAGVKVERFEWMKMQDASGVATFPNGDQIAWFKDPDGNTLSLAELVE